MRPPFAFPGSVGHPEPAPPTDGKRAPDFRRIIARPQWLANRARNALRRSVFIGAVSVAAFLTVIVSMVMAPRMATRVPATVPHRPRPDTLSVLASAAIARVRVTSADSTLALERSAANARQALVSDSMTVAARAARDLVLARMAQIDSARTRAEQAPLASSYRALGDVSEMRSDPRVKALLDSLAQVDRERDALGSIGGVDPAFVAMTSRVNEIGHSLEAIATEKRRALSVAAGDSTVRTDTLLVTRMDTVAIAAQRDSNLRIVASSQEELGRLREVTAAMDLEEDRERERANAVAPPMALLASAFVLSAIIGFAVALLGEIRRPRLSSAAEAEKVLGIRVLSTIEPSVPSVERTRRQADREAPRYIDPHAEGYQLGYLGLATEHPTVLSAIITGDDPRISAVVACNLAAIAADEARTTVLVELERSCSAAAVLKTRVSPGISEIASRDDSWSDATVSAPIGRSRSIDLIPYGRTHQEPQAVVSAVASASDRLVSRYDAVLLLSDPATVKAGLPAQSPASALVFCAQPGVTPIGSLAAELEQMRAAGAHVRGLILWNADRPMLATPRELAAKRLRQQSANPLAVAH